MNIGLFSLVVLNPILVCRFPLSQMQITSENMALFISAPS